MTEDSESNETVYADGGWALSINFSGDVWQWSWEDAYTEAALSKGTAEQKEKPLRELSEKAEIIVKTPNLKGE